MCFSILTCSLIVKKTLPSALCLTPAIINFLYFSEEQTNIFPLLLRFESNEQDFNVVSL